MAYKDPGDPRSKKAKLAHYYANKDQYLERNREKKESIRRFLRTVKSFPCLDCDTEYPYYVMQFDHLPGAQKTITPAALVNSGSWSRVVKEIMMCEIVCANCHAERTHQRGAAED